MYICISYILLLTIYVNTLFMSDAKKTLIDLINAAIETLDINSTKNELIEINNSMNNQEMDVEIMDLDIDDFYVFYVKDLKNDHNLLTK